MMAAGTPQVAAAEAAGKVVVGGVSKAGQIIAKPVVGRKRTRTLTYKTEVERDGKIVDAVVIETDEGSTQVGGLGAILLGLGALIGLGAVAGAVSSTNARLKKREGDV